MPKSGGKKLFVSKCGSKCGVKWKCGVKTLRRQNVASGTNVVAPPKWWKCGFKQCGVEMWRQAQIWWRLRKWPKCGVKQCGVRDKCGGSPKCGVKQCGVKMWRQAQMWWQSEMWRQTMWRQNVASDTPFAKLFSRKCVFKKGIQWQAQKCYTKCLCPGKIDSFQSWTWSSVDDATVPMCFQGNDVRWNQGWSPRFVYLYIAHRTVELLYMELYYCIIQNYIILHLFLFFL